jgi:hypothetical protein
MGTEFECKDWAQFVRMLNWAFFLGLGPRIGLSEYNKFFFNVYWR